MTPRERGRYAAFAAARSPVRRGRRPRRPAVPRPVGANCVRPVSLVGGIHLRLRRVPRARTHVKSNVRPRCGRRWRSVVNTRIGSFRCRPAVQTEKRTPPSRRIAACPVRARTCNHTSARFAGGAVNTRIGAFRCRTAVRGEGVPVTNSFDFRSALLRLFVQCCFVTKTRCLVINASRYIGV
jgi:hypothetical protein